MERFSIILMTSVAYFVSSCKGVETTNAPVAGGRPNKMASVAGSGNATVENYRKPLVTGVKDAPLDEMPRVAIDIDLSACVGASRWTAVETPASTQGGAVSVVLSTTSEGVAQPDPWVYRPMVTTSNDDALQEKDKRVWRLFKTASYTIDVTAYDLQSKAVESKLSSKIDFTSSNDISLSLKGSWETSLGCSLTYK